MSKLKTLPQLRRTAARERRAGRTSVLATGGCDLVHAGHVRYLRAAGLSIAAPVRVHSPRSALIGRSGPRSALRLGAT